jgi:hypothetical protein
MIDKITLRSTIFKHLDGLVTAPVAHVLHEKGVLSYILDKNEVTLTELTEQFKANEGYLNVGLRVLCSQGFLDYHINTTTDQIKFSINDKSAIAFPMFYLYEDVIDLLHFSMQFRTRLLDDFPFVRLALIFDLYKKNYGISFSNDVLTNEIQHQILMHIEGSLVGPILVRLGMSGMFHKYFMEISFRPEEFHKSPENFKIILDFFVDLGWFTQKKGNYQFTEKGLFFAKRAAAYGVTVSYLPTFSKMEELVFGNPNILRTVAEGEDEIHVDREMNVAMERFWNIFLMLLKDKRCVEKCWMIILYSLWVPIIIRRH